MKKIIMVFALCLLTVGCSSKDGTKTVQKADEKKGELIAEYDGALEAGTVLDNENPGIHVYLEEDGSRKDVQDWEIRYPKELEAGKKVSCVIYAEDLECLLSVTGEAPKEEENVYQWEAGERKVRIYKDAIGTTWAQVIIPIINTGKGNLYVSASSVDLEDAEGHLTDSLNMINVYPDIIQPGETGYIYVETTTNTEVSENLTAIPNGTVSAAKNECIRYEVSDTTLKNGSYLGLEMTGRVENQTDHDGSLVYVAAILFDSSDQPIGAMFTIIMDGLSAGEKRGFSISSFSLPDDITKDAVARYEVYAYPLQYQF